MTQLIKKIIIKGNIQAESGIMIGGTNSALSIGGTDKQVVRNPLNKRPYIPGSSLKGKMRSLVELRDATIGADNGPTNDPNTIAAQLFGYIGTRENEKKQQPSRLIIRDSELLINDEDEYKHTDLLYTESKSENSINRITAKANPRTFERVPKGSVFNLEMIINVFDSDSNSEMLLPYTFDALRLVQDDYIGGGGSRGNGQVKFSITKVTERSSAYYHGQAEEKDITGTCNIPQDLK